MAISWFGKSTAKPTSCSRSPISQVMAGQPQMSCMIMGVSSLSATKGPTLSVQMFSTLVDRNLRRGTWVHKAWDKSREQNDENFHTISALIGARFLFLPPLPHQARHNDRTFTLVFLFDVKTEFVSVVIDEDLAAFGYFLGNEKVSNWS